MKKVIPDLLKQKASNFRVTEARHGTSPIWLFPQFASALMRGITAKCSSVHPNLNKTKWDILMSIFTQFHGLWRISAVLTCTFPNLCWELSLLVILRQSPTRGMCRGSGLQRHRSRIQPGCGHSSGSPGSLQQCFAFLLGKLDTAWKDLKENDKTTTLRFDMTWLLTSDLARVLIREDGCKGQHRCDAQKGNPHDDWWEACCGATAAGFMSPWTKWLG